jgi:hypothetical protein
MTRAVLRGLALAAAASAIAALPASARVYRGAGVDDPEMPVKVKLSGTDVIFEYTDVRVGCSDGSEPRQGGASHSDRLNDRRRFRDRLEIEGATSLVKGKVRDQRATGTLHYDLAYEGGECHSGKVEWKAKRK